MVITVSCTIEIIEQPIAPIGTIDNESGAGTSIKDSVSLETLNTIPIDLGELGFTIDTRKLVVFGYKPVKVNVELFASLSSYSQQDIVVDEFTHTAIFKLAIEDLTEDTMETFANGVPIKITLFDKDNNLLETISNTKFVISGTNTSLVITTIKPRIFNPLKIHPDIPHYIRISGTSSAYFLGGSSEGFSTKASDFIYLNKNLFLENSESVQGQIQKFYFVALGDDTYAIKTEFENSYLEYTNGSLSWNKSNKDNNGNFVVNDTHKFVLEQTESGLVKIRSIGSSNYLKSKELGEESYLSTTGTSKILEFEILAANMTWESNDLGTNFSAAIIPPAEMDFVFTQTIVNCSAATGEFYVGIDSEETSATSMSFQESSNIFSSETDSKSATASVEASGGLFGVDVTVSVSGTLETSSTTGYDKAKGASEGSENSETETVSSNRKITVPPYTAVEVLDVVQKLDVVRIPFVQRFFVRGQTNDGIPLSGEEIETQFLANRFDGVIVLVGSDFLEYSIRGTTVVSNYFDFRNTVNDIEGACN
tara:strand:- start:31150 stop:32760 length:1611 start_codon:yes stop_codon:yes gene_type:complete